MKPIKTTTFSLVAITGTLAFCVGTAFGEATVVGVTTIIRTDDCPSGYKAVGWDSVQPEASSCLKQNSKLDLSAHVGEPIKLELKFEHPITFHGQKHKRLFTIKTVDPRLPTGAYLNGSLQVSNPD